MGRFGICTPTTGLSGMGRSGGGGWSLIAGGLWLAERLYEIATVATLRDRLKSSDVRIKGSVF